MNFRNIEKARDYEVEKWIKEKFPEITDYQKSKIVDMEFVRFAPFDFFKKRKETTSILLRLSIIFIPVVWLILFICFPLTFIFSGRWGYGKKFNWILNWIDKVRIN